MTAENERIRHSLFEMQDEEYRIFQQGLMPNVEKERVIGVRTPFLRALAKKIHKDGGAEAFLKELPHAYYEENNLHAFLIEQIGDYEKTLQALEDFLPYVDNWATCDMMCPHVLQKNPEKTYQTALKWMQSSHEYTIRFGMETLMRYELEERFTPEVLEKAAQVKSKKYYVQMMQAWFFATALAKQFEAAAAYLKPGILDEWVRKKAIQKAVESRRISEEDKAYLKTLR